MSHSDGAGDGEATRGVSELTPDPARPAVRAGPSGYETAPAAVWAQPPRPLAQRSQHRCCRHILRRVSPRANADAGADGAGSEARRLIVMGHIDEIGLIVTHIDDEGYLWFREVGGWDAQILVGQRVAHRHARRARSRA